METATKKMRDEDNHKHKGIRTEQWNKDAEKVQTELEARLKTQEYKEMLKRLK